MNDYGRLAFLRRSRRRWLAVIPPLKSWLLP